MDILFIAHKNVHYVPNEHSSKTITNHVAIPTNFMHNFFQVMFTKEGLTKGDLNFNSIYIQYINRENYANALR